MYIYEHNCSSFVHSWKAHYFLHIFTFTFTHLADAFIQNDLQLHSGYKFFLSVYVFPGNQTHNLLRR